MEKDKSIFIKDNMLEVDLDKIDFKKTVTNDKQFAGEIGSDKFFWVSGGGTLLLNDNYILLVKRGKLSKVNPDKYSLFTGRSNSLKEALNPFLLLRELFEELLLFEDNFFLYPKCLKFQDIIDLAIGEADSVFKIKKENKVKDFYLEEYACSNNDLVIRYKNKRQRFKMNYYINKNNDINLLFLLRGFLDIEKIHAVDGEYIKNGSDILKQNRDIYLFNILDSEARNVTFPGSTEKLKISDEEFTEHCYYIINCLRKNILK
ncbi:MAG: hypothetical protein ACYCXO_02505 [Candidatus Humimicrobiaceae bacterium]